MKIDESNRKEIITNQTIVAFLIGLIISFIAISIDLITRDLELTISSVITIIRTNPVQWVLVAFPIVTGLYIFVLITKYVNELFHAHASLDKYAEKEQKVKRFMQALIKNDFSTDFEISSKDDIVGNTLNTLKTTLKENREKEEKRRKEDELRNWMAESHAKFGEILRADNDDMDKLAFNVISELTRHLNAIQGGFYLLNDDKEEEKYFDLIAFYAYNRKKYANQQLKWGEGMVGTCAIEKSTIYMKEMPEDYVRITSGLGEANPDTLLLIPLKTEEDLYGVLELASLNKFEQHQIEFAEQLALSIATTFSTLRTNVKTAKLLEETKLQAEALSSQEEEMRQNMEELQATQEEAARQSKEFINLSNTVNHTLIRAEYSTEGILTYANTKFINKLEYQGNSEVEGKHISIFIGQKDEEWFNDIWKSLANGGRHFEGYMKHITKNGKDLWTMATYTCVRDENGEVDRILFLGLDTTEQKKLSLNLEAIVDAVNRSGLKVEFDVNGNILEYSEGFLNIFKYKPKDVAKLNVFDLIDNNELEIFNKKWENIINGMGFQGQFKVLAADKKEKWIRATFSAVYDMYGSVDKVILIGQDITYEKQMEFETKEQADQLKKQEKQLREYGKDLSTKLTETRNEIKEQFKEIEKMKLRNERTLEGALDAIITINADHKIEFFNRAAEQMWGYTKKEVMGNDVHMLFDSDTIQNNEFVKQYVGFGDNKIIGERKEIKICDKDGNIKPVLILLSKADVENERTYTAFIQNIEVELF
jgi:PAS domain S-box-containing protein